LLLTQCFTENSGLQPGIKKVSAFPLSSHSDPGEGAFSRLDYGSLLLRAVVLLALLSELTRLASGQRGRLHPGFRRFSRPLRRRTSLQCQLGNLHWQDSHMLDHQLASLHYPGALLGRFFNNNDYHGQPDASLGHPPTSFEGNKKNRPIKAWAGQPTVFEWAGSSPGSRVRARLVWFSILGLARLQFLY
jgi:hypothetical protein